MSGHPLWPEGCGELDQTLEPVAVCTAKHCVCFPETNAPEAELSGHTALICDDCETKDSVTDWRSPYDPTPGPLPLCEECATARCERAAGADK